MNLLVPPPIVALLCAGAAWGIDRWAPIGEFAFPGQHTLAVLLIAIGLSIDATAVIAFFRARTTIMPHQPENTRELVIGGFYRISRNPMYLGLLLVMTGWVLWLGQALGALVLVGFVAWITRFQIMPEERALEDKFGESYRQYRGRVRRWI